MAAPVKVKPVTSVFRPGLFRNKVAIVTGGGTGIGKAITLELLYLGCNVMIASRKLERLEQSAKEMRSWLKEVKNPARLEYMTCNIRKEEDIKKLISTTLETFGKLDFLVNNAGGQFISRAEDIRPKGWHAVIETNLTGTFFMCVEAYKQWMCDHGGVIVNIIADMWKGLPLMAHTGAARSGVDNITKTLALEWVHNGVRINSVAPGGSIYSETAAANYGDDKAFDRVIGTVPMKRLGKVEEVSSSVCFLLSPSSKFITGETLKVDAAQSLYATVNLTIPEFKSFPPYTWENDLKAQQAEEDQGTEASSPPKSKL